MDYALATVIIGVVATTAMTSFLWLLSTLHIAEVNMVRAIGSLATRSAANATLPGLMIHFCIGVILCRFYILFMEIPGLGSTIGYGLLGGFLGAMHGIVVSIALVVLVAEHHPLKQYQKAGFSVALYHVVGHIIYGSVIGFLYGFWLLR